MYTLSLKNACSVTGGQIKFEEFSLDCDRYELLRAGRPIKLEKLPMELLILLVEKNGHLVTRQEIIERLWGAGVFLDTEHGVNTAVRKVRHALRDDTERPRFIQTVTGKGYRFVAEKLNAGPSSSVDSDQHLAQQPRSAPGNRRPWWAAAITATALFLLAGGALAFNAGGLRDQMFFVRKRPSIHSIAVLPLANLSGDPAQDYYADGMTDELITMLAKNSALRVISRTSAMQYKGARRPVREIAKELGVDGIVEGSVARSANLVHMTVQLIYAPNDTHLWAESYDRDPNLAFSLPSELSKTIAAQLKLSISPRGAQAYINPDAHSEYLQGLYYSGKGKEIDLQTAVTHFERALEVQPDYGSAYAELAMSYFWLGHADANGPSAVQTLPRAKAAAARALQLEPTLGSTHLALALLATSEWNWSEAETQYQNAIRLDASCEDCFVQYAALLQALGKNEDAVVKNKIAIELNPLDDLPRNQSALISFTSRNYDLAISKFSELHEAAWFAPFGLAYVQKGMYQNAIAEMNKCEVNFGRGQCLGLLAHVYGISGNEREAKRLLAQLKAMSRDHYVFPTVFAEAYLGLHDKEHALKCLEQAYAEQDPWLFWLKVWPTYDSVRVEPRFRVLMEKLHFQ